jgi:hypothetical protein
MIIDEEPLSDELISYLEVLCGKHRHEEPPLLMRYTYPENTMVSQDELIELVVKI